ncbi:MAG: acyloxyacyl hydrolase [Rubrivivax sp.]|nr:acyloxyacyl hydrolase [Burkholderiales bacterium]MCW5632085.1 acyloxyacyl hydrolase [Rubrivivax sp.]
MSIGAARCRWSSAISAALLALALICAPGARALCLWPGAEEGAQQTPGECPAYGFGQWSRSNRSEAFAAGVLWPWIDAPPLWPGRLTWQIEATVGAWRSLASAQAGEPHFSLQLGLKPSARWAFGPGWFLEAGIGLNVVTPRYRGGDRRFSTRLNFGDHIALGVRFGERGRHELQVRVEHFSNAGLRRPNPGEDFGQVRYAWRF